MTQLACRRIEMIEGQRRKPGKMACTEEETEKDDLPGLVRSDRSRSMGILREVKSNGQTIASGCSTGWWRVVPRRGT